MAGSWDVEEEGVLKDPTSCKLLTRMARIDARKQGVERIVRMITYWRVIVRGVGSVGSRTPSRRAGRSGSRGLWRCGVVAKTSLARGAGENEFFRVVSYRTENRETPMPAAIQTKLPKLIVLQLDIQIHPPKGAIVGFQQGIARSPKRIVAILRLI